MDKNVHLTFVFQDEVSYRFALIAFKDVFQTSDDDAKREITLTYDRNFDRMKAELENRLNFAKVILTNVHISGTYDDFQEDLLKYLHMCLYSSAICLTQPEESGALHRFRVDLRALRSLLYNARQIDIQGLDALSLRLKNLSKTSNAARDNEVMAMLYDKYGSYNDINRIQKSSQLRDDAFLILRNHATALWLDLISTLVQSEKAQDYLSLLDHATQRKWKKWKRRFAELDLKDDIGLHALRIDLKKLNVALSLLQSHGYDVVSRLEKVKTLQSDLGQIRDLRRFYVLPGLDAQTRYRAVSKLTTLEAQVKERLSKKGK